MKNYSDPPLHTTPPPLYPPCPAAPEIWAELDHTLSGGGFVD